MYPLQILQPRRFNSKLSSLSAAAAAAATATTATATATTTTTTTTLQTDLWLSELQLFTSMH